MTDWPCVLVHLRCTTSSMGAPMYMAADWQLAVGMEKGGLVSCCCGQEWSAGAALESALALHIVIGRCMSRVVVHRLPFLLVAALTGVPECLCGAFPQELFRQGDRERAAKQPISPLMDRWVHAALILVERITCRFCSSRFWPTAVSVEQSSGRTGAHRCMPHTALGSQRCLGFQSCQCL